VSLRDGEGAEVVALLQQRIHGRLRGPESDPHHLIRVMPAEGNRLAGFRLLAPAAGLREESFLYVTR
jgi:hypothetical protein